MYWNAVMEQQQEQLMSIHEDKHGALKARIKALEEDLREKEAECDEFAAAIEELEQEKERDML